MSDIIRETNGENLFMQVQVGRMETRPEQLAIFEKVAGTDRDSKRIIGYRDGTGTVQVFRLLGFGYNLKDAERMARRSS